MYFLLCYVFAVLVALPLWTSGTRPPIRSCDVSASSKNVNLGAVYKETIMYNVRPCHCDLHTVWKKYIILDQVKLQIHFVCQRVRDVSIFRKKKNLLCYHDFSTVRCSHMIWYSHVVWRCHVVSQFGYAYVVQHGQLSILIQMWFQVSDYLNCNCSCNTLNNWL